MRNKLQTLVLLIVSLVASATFWVLFEGFDILEIKSELINITYIVIKSFILLTIVFVWLYGRKDKEPSNTYILVRTTIWIQLIPLAVRLLGTGTETDLKSFVAVFISVVTILAYIALVIVIDKSNLKIKAVLPTLKADEISVVNEKQYFNEKGEFKGANHKEASDE